MIAGPLLLVAGAAATIAALLAPHPFVGVLAGPMLFATGVAVLQGADRQRSAARRRSRRQRRARRRARGGYVI